MNNILSTGESRSGTGGISVNFSFENQSTILGENAGKDLKIGAFASSTLQRNFLNTFLGFKVGQNVLSSVNNVYIGNKTGIDLNGSNNIILGTTRENEGSARKFAYDILSIGNNNHTELGGMTFGTSNDNNASENLVIGMHQHTNGKNNVLLGFRNTSSGERNISIGNDVLQESVTSNYIAIGNNIYISERVMSSNYIQIGNNLGSNMHSINIGNTIVRGGDNDILFLGLGDGSNVLNSVMGAAGEDFNDIDEFIGTSSNMYGRTYVKNGIYTDMLSFGNFREDNMAVTIVMPSSSFSNIAFSSNTVVYTLPEGPTGNGISVLGTNQRGDLSWIDDATFFIKSIDQIAEGTSNKYYNEDLVDARVNAKFSDMFTDSFDTKYNDRLQELSLDMVGNGTNNRFITNNAYDRDLFVFGTLTVNKIKVLGGNSSGESGTVLAINTSNELLDMIFKLTKRIEDLEQNIA